jgi:hypothetical protein
VFYCTVLMGCIQYRVVFWSGANGSNPLVPGGVVTQYVIGDISTESCLHPVLKG